MYCTKCLIPSATCSLVELLTSGATFQATRLEKGTNKLLNSFSLIPNHSQPLSIAPSKFFRYGIPISLKYQSLGQRVGHSPMAQPLNPQHGPLELLYTEKSNSSCPRCPLSRCAANCSSLSKWGIFLHHALFLLAHISYVVPNPSSHLFLPDRYG